jgi:O-mycaminosyltylonolide 6-deoxyallosyltransferase
MGDIQPLLALTMELRARGHTAMFGAPPNFADRVRKMKIEFVPLGPAPDLKEFREVYGRAFSNSDPLEHVRRTLPLAIRDAPRMINELTAASTGADLLISLPYQLAGAIVHELADIPLVSVHLSAFGGFSRRFADETSGAINGLRAAYGLPPVYDPLGPAGGSSLLSLYGISPSLFPRPRRWPDHCHSTGFFFLDEEWSPERDLARFIAAGEEAGPLRIHTLSKSPQSAPATGTPTPFSIHRRV